VISLAINNPAIEMALIVISITEEKPCPSIENMAAVVMYNTLVEHYQNPLIPRNVPVSDRVIRQMAEAGINTGILSDIKFEIRNFSIFSLKEPEMLRERVECLHLNICAILEDINAQPVSIDMLEE